MFEELDTVASDPLLALIDAHRSDTRPGKIDLGVGVYRDEAGATPIMSAVRQAERVLLETRSTKSYLGVEGDPVYVDRLWQLLSVRSADRLPYSGLQTPGGSGALRLAADLVAQTPGRRIWLGLPSWPNHAAIFEAAGLEVRTFPFFDARNQRMHFDRMVEALEHAQAGDAVLVHAGCHNPTGAVLSADEWRRLIHLIADRGLLPLVDLAYQGFGKGIVEDCESLRAILPNVPEALLAVSSSKSFSLYRERTGALFAISRSATGLRKAASNLAAHARTNYSMPPDHGAAIVRTILEDPELTRDWAEELSTMRDRLNTLRWALASALSPRWPALRAIASQEGMFSMLPVSPETVASLRRDHGIYLPASGRINILGLTKDSIPHFVERLAGFEGPGA